MRRGNLILSRAVNQKIVIRCPDGARIEIAPSEIKRDRVRIAIDAPLDYQIHRLELIDEEIAAELAELHNGKPATF